ncbi:MAG: HEAT repeat domain-containing protein, partial [Anaerolineae bacterium]|nr:HEAT repeat domain-containing protein [Anaerolineae bacterium]
ALRRPRRRRLRAEEIAQLRTAVERLSSEAVEDRLAAARQLSRLPDRRAALALIEALRDPSPRVRAEAARGLGPLGYRRLARAHPIQALEDTDPRVREAAAGALGQLGDSWAIPALRHLAEMESTARVRRAVWEALRRIGEAQGPEAFFG